MNHDVRGNFAGPRLNVVDASPRPIVSVRDSAFCLGLPTRGGPSPTLNEDVDTPAPMSTTFVAFPLGLWRIEGTLNVNKSAGEMKIKMSPIIHQFSYESCFYR